MNKMFVNPNIPSEYKYLGNMTNAYFDLYNTNNPQGRTVDYYRVYYSYDDNFYLVNTQTYSNYQSYNFPEIERTDSILSSVSNYKIAIVCFVIIFLIVFLFNVISSIIKRGGIFSGS